MKINNLASSQHFNNPRMNPRGLVIHTTANRSKSADDLAHDRYYDNNSDRVSVHWSVDQDSATLSVPEHLAAWHTGNKEYNLNWIGMEICENNVQNNKMDEATYKNAVWLAADILHRHGWSINKMIRHCDVPGREWKNCPNRDLIHWPTFKANVEMELHKRQKPEVEGYCKAVCEGVEVEGVIINSTSYIPARAISELLGATVTWDAKTNTVNIDRG